MPDKVFISHSSKDQELADAVREYLESAGLTCWIAPRDIEPGTDWTEGIMRGIASSRAFVLVFSGHANDSEHVRREVGEAFSLHLPVIPFRTETVEPRAGLRYFLESVHWFDASKPPLQQHLPALADRVKAVLNGDHSASPLEFVPAKGPKQAPLAAAHKRQRWLGAIGLIIAAAIIADGVWFLATNQKTNESNPILLTTNISPKSIAVLPFESLSPNKDDTYFADGVQDDILNNLAKIAELTVISRTSVMQYRAAEKRDLRQIANALGVANVLEGTIRRIANRIRVNTDLIDARHDKTIWADSFDRDLTDIFAIQSEVAQAIANKLAATLSPDEKRNIEKKPTENLEAYDLYLRAKELLVIGQFADDYADGQKQLLDAIALLDRAIRLDPRFTLAYCQSANAHDFLYQFYEPTPERRALGDAAIRQARALGPELPEVHLASAFHFYATYHDYERALEQLAIVRRGLPNDSEALRLEALIDRRQGRWEKAIKGFEDAYVRDPRNSLVVDDLATTYLASRQFRASGQMYDRLVELRPEEPILKLEKPLVVSLFQTGDTTAARAAINALPASVAADRGVLGDRLLLALFDREWTQAKELIEKLNGGDDEGDFAFAQANVPVGCYSILLARLQGEPVGSNTRFAQTREQLSQRVQKAPEEAPLLSQLAVVDALLNNKETAIAEARQAVQLLPSSTDSLAGPRMELNLAVVYSWTNELDLAFQTLTPLVKAPDGLYYGQLKLQPYWDPLRQDPRYEKLLAELAPR